MIKAGIFGATGYAGEQLIGILLGHPDVKITYLSRQKGQSQKIGQIYPQFAGKLDLVCHAAPDIDEAVKACDLVFLALPHTVSMDFVPALLEKKIKVIDLSADYRLKDAGLYEKWYKKAHKDAKTNRISVYGLPELYRHKIKKADFIANPGCYPTAAILAVAPLLKKKLIKSSDIIIDAKSGFSGAGRETVEKSKAEILVNFKAYKINAHQHSPEINQELTGAGGGRVDVVFVPHLLPLEKGILETVYLKAAGFKKPSSSALVKLYKDFYKGEPFVRVLDEGVSPQLKDVVGTNFCDIGVTTDGRNIIVIAAIDNLLKGASGQAVQNMNIMFGFDEKAGL